MDETLSFEELDLSTESNALEQVSDLVDLLQCKLTQIATEGRISKAQATQLVNQYHVDFGKRYPLASFTELASPTNLTIAQEGVLSSIGQYLMDLVKQAYEIIKKIFNWILELIGFRRKREEQVANVVNNIDTVNKAADTVKASGAADVVDEELQKILDEFSASFNDLWHDFLVTNTVLPMMHALEPAIERLVANVQLRLTHLKNTINSGQKLNDFDLAVSSNYKAGSNFSAAQPLKAILTKYKIAYTDDQTPKELMGAVTRYVSQLSVQHNAEPLTFEQANKIITDKSIMTTSLMLSSDAAAKDLAAIVKEIHMYQIRLNQEVSDEGRKQVKIMVDLAINESIAVQQYYNLINICGHSRDTLINMVWRCVSAHYQSLYVSGMQNPDESVRTQTKRTTDQMKGKLKK